jgi:chaperonin cofactor prefoldin
MALVQRIAGGVLFVVALTSFLLCATGTIGVWIAKSAVDETTLALIDTVTDYLDLAVQTIDTLDRNITDLEQRLSLLQSTLPALGTEGANGPAAQRMRQLVTDELQPALEQLTTRAQRLRTGLENLNQRAEQLNRMPFVEVPTLTGVLATLDEQVEAARTQSRALLTAIETRDRVLLQSASDGIDQRLSQARAILAEGSARISAIRLALIDIHQVLTFWSTVSTTVLSALLVVFALGQISLAVHAWGWMRGRRTLSLQVRPT